MTRRTRRAHPRRGTILIVLVVLLLVATSIAGAVMHAALRDARQLTVDREALQADRLAEAGLSRAVVRLSSDTAFAGETWEVDVGDGSRGRVVITVTGADRERRAEAVATYPIDSDRPVRSRISTDIPLPSSRTPDES